MKTIDYLVICILLLSFGTVACASDRENEVMRFSESIRDVVASRDKVGFIDLAWSGNPPRFSGEHKSGMYEYLFGSGEENFSVAKFFKETDTEIHIVRYGCEKLRREDECYDRYLVYYYDESKIDFGKGLEAETLSRLFEVAFVELTILWRDGSFVLTDYPFTYGAEPSWEQGI